MQNFDTKNEISNRLRAAEALTDISAENKDILIQIINLEMAGQLTGQYAGIPNQVYHHPLCSGYSSTTIKRIIEQSYNHWFCNKSDDAHALHFGSAFHAFCNEPHVFSKEFIVTNEKNYAGQKTKITFEDFKLIEVMSKKLFEHPDSAPLIKNSKSELTFFSQDNETGLWKKCRVDNFKGRSVSDLKTTMNASALSFARDARKYLYRISASYYLEVISEVMGESFKDFYLIACEKTAPHEVAVYRVSDQSIEQAQTEIRNSLRTIKGILDQGETAWRGYQLGIKEISI